MLEALGSCEPPAGKARHSALTWAKVLTDGHQPTLRLPRRRKSRRQIVRHRSPGDRVAIHIAQAVEQLAHRVSSLRGVSRISVGYETSNDHSLPEKRATTEPKGRIYLQSVKSQRNGGQMRQRVNTRPLDGSDEPE